MSQRILWFLVCVVSNAGILFGYMKMLQGRSEAAPLRKNDGLSVSINL